MKITLKRKLLILISWSAAVALTAPSQDSQKMVDFILKERRLTLLEYHGANNTFDCVLKLVKRTLLLDYILERKETDLLLLLFEKCVFGLTVG